MKGSKVVKFMFFRDQEVLYMTESGNVSKCNKRRGWNASLLEIHGKHECQAKVWYFI